MYFTKNNRPIEKLYTMCDYILQRVHDTRYLGVNIGKDLTSSKTCNRAYSTLMLWSHLQMFPVGFLIFDGKSHLAGR